MGGILPLILLIKRAKKMSKSKKQLIEEIEELSVQLGQQIDTTGTVAELTQRLSAAQLEASEDAEANPAAEPRSVEQSEPAPTDDSDTCEVTALQQFIAKPFDNLIQLQAGEKKRISVADYEAIHQDNPDLLKRHG